MNELGKIYMLQALSGPRIGYSYVGQTKDLYRKSGHLRLLRKNQHHSKKLQYYYNKYGESSLVFHEFFQCPKNELDFWEKFWIKCFLGFEEDEFGVVGFNGTEGGLGNPGKYKPCTMENMITGEIVNSPSVQEFAQNHNTSESGVSDVINGNRTHIFDWFCPKNPWRPKWCELISPDGIPKRFLSIRKSKFAKENGLLVNSLSALLRKTIDYHRGWKRHDSRVANRGKRFKLLNPNGDIINGENICKFCQDNNLSKSAIHSVINGRTESYKGWKNYPPLIKVKKISKAKLLKFINPQGEIIEEFNNLAKFAKKHGLDWKRLGLLNNGRISIYRGWVKSP